MFAANLVESRKLTPIDSMDPNPESFPILSYVMSRLDGAHDTEQPPPHGGEAQLPRLQHPALLASMASVASDVAHTRSVLLLLGDRPDHKAVGAARARIVEVDADLSRRLEEIVRTPRPEALGRLQWRGVQAVRERECRATAQHEKADLRAVIQLAEMHEAYERLLLDTEDRLAKMYAGGADDDSKGDSATGHKERNEDIRILQGTPGNCLEKVDLSARQLRYLPEAFWKLRRLLFLNLSNNHLQAIPDAIGRLEYLEELYLSSNRLVLLPDSIGLLLKLKILDVSSNKLKSLPDNISKCRALIELNVSYNELTYLPTNIGFELQHLQKLCVHLNKMRSLPRSVCEMRSLRFLDAHFNKLRGLPDEFGQLRNLEILDLSSNFSDLKELPATFGDLVKLRELNLSNNQIHALPDTFGRLDKLLRLNLDQNPLVVPPVDVVSHGVVAVREYMTKRFLGMLLVEEGTAEEVSSAPSGWLTRSTSWLSNWFSASISGDAREKSNNSDDEQL